MKDGNANSPGRRSGLRNSILGRTAVFCGLLLLPLILGAWQDISGNTINPRFVERIKDGQTTKHEILLWFGDPKEVERNPEGPVYKYFSYKDAPLEPSRQERVIDEHSSMPYFLDDEKKIKKVPQKTAGKILRSTLTVRFKPDGETVMSHEYKEQ
jgi:hypothetical protein